MARAGAPAECATEILVVGSGAVGAACASRLARAGRRVAVLSTPDRCTTATSGGHLLLQSKRPGPVLDLARRSLELLAHSLRGREDAAGFVCRGSLIAAVGREEEALLRDHFERLVAAGLPVEWLGGRAARDLEPGLSPGVTAATFCPLDAQVHPGRLAACWLEDAAAAGATLHTGTAAALLLDAGRAAGAAGGERRWRAEQVVLAAGPWSASLAATAGLRLDVRPRRGVLLRSLPAARLAARPLLGAGYLASKFAGAGGVAFSFQQHPGGECVLGGSREFVGFSLEGVAELGERVLACAARYLPAVRSLAWDPPRAGFRPWTPGGEPLIGASAVPGLYLACGHEGDGITLAAGTAALLEAALPGGRARSGAPRC